MASINLGDVAEPFNRGLSMPPAYVLTRLNSRFAAFSFSICQSALRGTRLMVQYRKHPEPLRIVLVDNRQQHKLAERPGVIGAPASV